MTRKWKPLSKAGVALVGNLMRESEAWMNRPQRVAQSLRALADLGDPAAIPWLLDLVADGNTKIANEASTAVEALFRDVSPSQLPSLDALIRTDGQRGRGADLHPKSATDWVRTTPSRAVPLGLMASHGNGYVRQAAVARLDQEVTSGAEIPFLLVRLDDWVQSVQQAAETALMRRLTEARRPDYLQNLDLIARLEGRRRAVDSPILDRIKQLLRSDVLALALATVHANTAQGRRYGLRIAFEQAGQSHPDSLAAAFDFLTAKGDPGMRLHLAAWLARKSTPLAWQSRYLPKLTGDRYFAVRRIALGWCVQNEPADHRETLRSALLDPNQTVRTLAQYHLPRMENIDLRQFYLRALHESGKTVTATALSGLAETGNRGDVALILPFSHSRDVKTAGAAIRALAKLDPDSHYETFIEALQSSHPGLSRQGCRALEPSARAIAPSRLAAIQDETAFDHVRINALALINRLPKWQKLPILITIIAGGHVSSRNVAGNYLERWFCTYNHSHHIRPNSEELAAVRRALERHGASLARSQQDLLSWMSQKEMNPAP